MPPSPSLSSSREEETAQSPPPREVSWMDMFHRTVLCFFLINWAISYLHPVSSSSSSSISPPVKDINGKVHYESPSTFQQLFMNVDSGTKLPVFPERSPQGQRLGAHRNLFSSKDLVDLHLYITNHFYFDHKNSLDTVWKLENIPYNWSFAESRQSSLNLTVTEDMINKSHVNNTVMTDEDISDPSTKSSVYAHVFLGKSGRPIDSSDQNYNSNDVAYHRFDLIRWIKPEVEVKKYKLLDIRNDSVNLEDEVIDTESIEPVPHLCPSLHLANILDIPSFKRNNIPVNLSPQLHFNDLGAYYPVIYYNDFFTSSKSCTKINSTQSDFALDLSYSHMSFMRWQMQTQMELQWKKNSHGSSEKDRDIIREVLLDTNPVLLVITFLVSFLRSVFDFLAFKNDVQFWRKKKNMAGMSIRSLAVNCFFQTVILLYLMDNDTSWMILISSGIGLLIEYWKLGKAFDVKICREGSNETMSSKNDLKELKSEMSTREMSDSDPSISSPVEADSRKRTEVLLMGLSLSYKVSDGYSRSKTKEYDDIATTHLLYLVLPLVLGYSGYSLLHNSHKSFYSWFLGSLVGFVYAFGFVLMTPQLFINYKLKSVAHMPWKAMVYKSLNTFIDDLFAFVIKMPLMHRLSCFRDDIIFFIYLYQKWVYKVDHSRMNEFGQGGDEDGNEDAATSLALKPEQSTTS